MKRRLVILESNRAGNGFRCCSFARQEGFEVAFITDSLKKYDLELLKEVFGELVFELNYWDLNASHSWFASFAPERILTFDDFHLIIANVHAQVLGIEANTLRSLYMCLDKGACRAHLQTTAINWVNPTFAILHRQPNDCSLPTFDGYPAVLKPSMESGSLAIAEVKHRGDLAKMSTYVRSLLERSPTTVNQPLLLEGRIEGREFSVEAFADEDGRWHALGVCETFIGKKFVEVGHTLPARITPEQSALLCDSACRVASEMGLTSGLAHIEFKLTDQGVRLIEINPRNAGDRIPVLYDFVYERFFIESALLNHTSSDAPACGAAHIRFLAANSEGEVGQIIFPKHPAIVETYTRPLPAKVDSMTSNDDRLGHFIVTANDAQTAEHLADEIVSQIELKYL
jgi:biotin carboxylase